MKGNRVPKNEANENNWRKAEFLRPLSDVEAMLIGDGAGTEWVFLSGPEEASLWNSRRTATITSNVVPSQLTCTGPSTTARSSSIGRSMASRS